MLLSDYGITAGVSILFLVGCLLHLYENDIFTTQVTRKFRRLIYVVMAQIILDAVFMLLEGQGVSNSSLYAIKGVELFVNPLIALLVFDIFCNGKINKLSRTVKKLRTAMLSVISFNGILQVVNPFCGLIFFIDSNNLYHRGSLMFIYVLILVSAIALLMFELYIFSSKTQSTMKATLLAFAIILGVSVLLRGALSHSNYDFLCMSVAIPFLLIYYSHVTLRIDPLTHLLNRQVYSKIIEKINYTTIVIIIDANDFKLINDTYGHEYGDRALKELARAICKAYGKYAYCFRLGGDEFCAILKPGAFDELIDETPDCDVYSMAEEFMGRLDELVFDQGKDGGNSYLKYGASQGYGIFYSKKDHPNADEDIPLRQVIELADKRMYRSKNLSKESYHGSGVRENGLARARVVYEPSMVEVVDSDRV